MFVQPKTVPVHKVKPQNGQANNVHDDLKNPKRQSHDQMFVLVTFFF
jgi:hypothetical protein